MEEKILVAGAGGQGVMLLGKLLAEAAMRGNKFVTYLPAYGAEVRGGTANCMVVISDFAIGSPYIAQADTLIIMNAPSLDKFKARAAHKALYLLNSSLIDKGHGGRGASLRLPFTGTAVKLGNIRVANVVALGSYLALKKTVSTAEMERIIEAAAPADKKRLVAINLAALRAGMELVKHG